MTAWSISISPMWTENCLLLVLPQCYLPNKEPHSQPISQRAANESTNPKQPNIIAVRSLSDGIATVDPQIGPGNIL